LDLENQPVTWDRLIEAAKQTQTTIAAQGRRNESLMVWVNALVESAGGTILDEASQGQPASEVEAAIDSPAGQAAARIMNTLATSPAAPPALSTSGEEESRAEFQSDNGGFMVNWPYVWAAFDTAIEEGSLPANFKEDVGWTRYPRVDAQTESATPLGGIGISVGGFTRQPDLAVEAIRCLRSVESQKEYMLNAGDPAAASAVYEDPEVREKFPMADDIKEGLIDAAPRPISAYYGDVTGAIQQSYHPPDALSPQTTPQAAARLIEGVLSNEQLL
jgi:multiple sugar transport system substrate-binding protein